jgi:disulfide bond formation protein DsbB
MTTTLLFHIHQINLIFAICGLIALGVTFVLFYDYFRNHQRLFRRYVAPYVWWIIIVVTFGGVATTLLYSEVFGFIPCSLCWLQRVALYPQALLSIMAYRMKDGVLFPLYGVLLSVFGFGVAVYQYIYQAIPQELLESGIMPCLADGSADCSKKVMEVFGFVTFPFLSAVLFLLLIALYLHMRRSKGGEGSAL